MNKLKVVRLNKGFTQRHIAKLVGIQENSYQRYEYDVRVPDARTAIRIAKALRTTVEDLWGNNLTA